MCKGLESVEAVVILVVVSYQMALYLFFCNTAFTLTERSKVPEIDVVFALTATTGDADGTFQRMKDAVEIITDTYGMNTLRYSFIVYGALPKIIFDFRTNFPSRESLKYFIEQSRRATGRPDTKRALEEAMQVIRGSSVRPSAKKILVLLTDGASYDNPQDVEKAIQALNKTGVPVLTFALVNNPKTDFEVPKTVEPGELAVKVMEIVLAGKCICLYSKLLTITDNNNNGNNNAFALLFSGLVNTQKNSCSPYSQYVV